METNWKQIEIGPAASKRSRLLQGPENKTKILLLPGGKQDTSTIISSQTSSSIGWLKLAREIPEWIIKIYNFLRPYPSYHIYTDRSYKKRNQAYDDNFLANNGPAHPNRISAGASIIIAPQSEDWRDIQHPPLLCIHIKYGSSIGAQSVTPWN